MENDFCKNTLTGHNGSINCLKLLRNRRLASGSGDSSIKLWDLDNNKCIATLVGHKKAINCLELLKSGHLSSGSDDNTIRIWNLSDNNCLITLEGHLNSIQADLWLQVAVIIQLKFGIYLPKFVLQLS